MTHKERTTIDEAAFQAACLEYRIRCARRVLRLAPLPEFANAIAALENLRDGCTDRNGIKKVYKDLATGRKQKTLQYGYTPVGEIYLGLLGVLYSTLHPRNNITSSECQNFVEACYTAAQCVEPEGCDQNWAYGAMRAASAFQDKQYQEIFDAYRAEAETRLKECTKAA